MKSTQTFPTSHFILHASIASDIVRRSVGALALVLALLLWPQPGLQAAEHGGQGELGAAERRGLFARAQYHYTVLTGDSARVLSDAPGWGAALGYDLARRSVAAIQVAIRYSAHRQEPNSLELVPLTAGAHFGMSRRWMDLYAEAGGGMLLARGDRNDIDETGWIEVSGYETAACLTLGAGADLSLGWLWPGLFWRKLAIGPHMGLCYTATTFDSFSHFAPTMFFDFGVHVTLKERR